MKQVGWVSLMLCVLSACTASSPETEMDWDRLDRVVADLAYEHEITVFCGETPNSSLEVVLNGICAEDLRATAVRTVEEISREFEGAEAEYICTPEMFENARQRADEARQNWQLLKETES